MAEEEKKKLVVADTCIGCGMCENIAPEYFEVKDDGLSHVKKDYDEKDKDIINEAIDSCPVQAITLE
ncbi:ferredoxin [Candidatus Berkelbacteria bacterium CG10_big_fil_rev_8_21_14_0_10_43_13]|uniref:Ferredoxin n=1 Tax=Candidatus Berkelbacteria bacterium CG10_big_fil_rev_8_21_14_0_10_43_13 TaxID=1974514 RepID=A0A2H0W5L9_9BACT|nr:MAG: ferredoxin [Candidatus Berkelbacteria bacterium CG10_big_fil_rev_8_21_14_0_10_43_13]